MEAALNHSEDVELAAIGLRHAGLAGAAVEPADGPPRYDGDGVAAAPAPRGGQEGRARDGGAAEVDATAPAGNGTPAAAAAVKGEGER